jgi:long-chain acyl-CoA synthetase
MEKGRNMGIVGVLPLFQSFAMTTVMNTSIRIGGFQLLFPRPPADMAELFAAIEKHSKKGGLIMPGVAILFNKINTHPKVRNYDLSGLKMAVSGAGPLPLEVQNKFEEITGSIIVEGYGLSEATPVTHANPIHGHQWAPSASLTLIRISDCGQGTGTKELPPLPLQLPTRAGLTRSNLRKRQPTQAS